jgi:hypothetical protein
VAGALKRWEVARWLRLPELLLSAGAVGVFAIVLVAAEIVARRIDPHYLDRRRGPEVYSERYGWKLRPGFVGELHDVPLRLNARGYRGELHSYEKTTRKTRLVMLGDSVTFGSGVRDYETFSSLLEHRSDRYEVVNLAVEGYGNDQELLVLEDEGLHYHPDVVVLNICIANDPLDNYQPSSNDFRPKPRFSWDGRELVLHEEATQLSPPMRAIQWLADESHVINRLLDLLPPLPEWSPFRQLHTEPRPFNRHLANELTVRIVCRAGEVAHRGAADLLVLLHPDRLTFEGSSLVATNLDNALRDHGIRVEDLYSTYRAAGLSYSQIALDGQGHLTPLGHHFVAEDVERLLAATASRQVSVPKKR